MKNKDIHTNDHGNPKWHNYGIHGEHAHDYEWNEDSSLNNKTTRELTKEERIMVAFYEQKRNRTNNFRML